MFSITLADLLRETGKITTKKEKTKTWQLFMELQQPHRNGPPPWLIELWRLCRQLEQLSLPLCVSRVFSLLIAVPQLSEHAVRSGCVHWGLGSMVHLAFSNHNDSSSWFVLLQATPVKWILWQTGPVRKSSCHVLELKWLFGVTNNVALKLGWCEYRG